MQVSAVIPAYNAAVFLKETIESLLNQTKPFSEIVVVDDGSTDNTGSVVARIAAKADLPIRLVTLPENKGVSTARNQGLEIAKQDWLMFMDADDLAEPMLLEKLCGGLTEQEGINPGNLVLAHSAYTQINEQGQRLPGIHRGKQVEPSEILGYLLVRNQVISSGVLIKKSTSLQTGGFDTSLNFSEDWDFWLKLAGKGGFAYVDEPLVRVRRHPGNASLRLGKMLQGETAVLGKYPLPAIEKAVYKRKLSWEENTADFISLLYRLGFWDEGFQNVKKLVGKSSSYPTGFFLLGLYHAQNQAWSAAGEAFEATLKLLPSHGAALNNLGAVKIMENNMGSASIHLEQALSSYPGYLDASRNLALIEQKTALASQEVSITWRELRPVLTVYGN